MIGKMALQQFESAVDFLGQSYALDHFVNDPDAATGNPAISDHQSRYELGPMPQVEIIQKWLDRVEYDMDTARAML
jgi:hypothetical protein